MSFGWSNRVKTFQTRALFVTVLAATGDAPAPPHVAHADDPRHPCAPPYPLPAPSLSISIPFVLVKPSPSTSGARRRSPLRPPPRRSASIPHAPSCAASPRTCSTPPRVRLSRLTAESSRAPPAAIANPVGAPPLTPTTPLRPFSARFECPVSLPTPYSSSQSLSPREPPTAAAGNTPRAHAVGRPTRGPQAAAAGWPGRAAVVARAKSRGGGRAGLHGVWGPVVSPLF